ncbi:MAG: TnsA-like heteromeric transposase endonuclease subunit [Acidimicrobiales bacterium]
MKFRDSAGEIIHSELGSVSATALAAGRPWRTFRWHHGQAHFSGWYWTATTGHHVVYESRLELARLLLADFDPSVAAIAAQPLYLTACVNGKERNHVPDFLLLDGDAVVTVVNVKPADRLADPKVTEALGWAGAAFAERGWHHEIWTGTSPVQLSNVRFLAAYRDAARLDPTVVSAVAEQVEGPVRLCEIEQAWPERSDEARAAVLHLVWRGMIRADLSVLLSAETMLERVA